MGNVDALRHPPGIYKQIRVPRRKRRYEGDKILLKLLLCAQGSLSIGAGRHRRCSGVTDSLHNSGLVKAGIDPPLSVPYEHVVDAGVRRAC